VSGSAILEGIDAVVLSPGVPPTAWLVTEARRRGLPILGELELASRYSRSPIVAVTGTNGKSTTVTWIGHLLSAIGRPNVGGRQRGHGAGRRGGVGAGDGILVVEVSSFQLETTEEFRPDGGAWP
jgi:UDP-N-acetylmuramoylalanine--D-glutamate ligase